VTRDVHVVEDVEAVQALLHPLRLRILEALREPTSAAAVARQIGETRQKVNYHLKELEAAGLARPVGERRAGNLVEVLFEAVARSFVVSPRTTRADERRVDALRHQQSLERLVDLGDRLQHDAVVLLDRAAFDGEEIASLAVEIDVRFADEGDRAAFLRDYLETVKELCARYGARDGEGYRVVLAAHPKVETNEGDEQ
jgi:DNA-binding transcriptional ArsR family regulator